MDISYQEVYTINKEEARRLIIGTYLDTGNFLLTARLRRTSRHIVRKEERIILSPHTLRYILSRSGFKGKRKPRTESLSYTCLPKGGAYASIDLIQQSWAMALKDKAE